MIAMKNRLNDCWPFTKQYGPPCARTAEKRAEEPSLSNYQIILMYEHGN
jgi:hypothetical protein